STAGAGTHAIAYTYTDTNSCVNSDTANITVNALPQVDFPSLSDICVNAGNLTLNTATPTGGTYTGTGVNNNIFNPSVATVGNHTLTYTYTDGNNCVNSDSTVITVSDTSTLTFNNLA